MKPEERIKEIGSLLGRLKEHYPSVTNAFLQFMSKTQGGPSLTTREKELIQVALSVAGQCEWCIAHHVKAAAESGATRDEIMESGFLAVLMHGAPALMYLTPLMASVDQYVSVRPVKAGATPPVK
ncbi:MAG: carboxymuconolactone decarboxylase family protein [Phycisphaerae bacterium]